MKKTVILQLHAGLDLEYIFFFILFCCRFSSGVVSCVCFITFRSIRLTCARVLIDLALLLEEEIINIPFPACCPCLTVDYDGEATIRQGVLEICTFPLRGKKVSS